ncbi:ferredoxin [Mycobacterium sp. BMJ-28]
MTVRADNRLEDAPMVPVNCRRCGVEVQARKSSWNQTSVQWTDQALTLCEERCRAEQLAAQAGSNLFLACSALTGSIVDAVRAGILPMVDDGGL